MKPSVRIQLCAKYYLNLILQDYPSIAHLVQKLSDNNIQIIFAVTQEFQPVYKVNIILLIYLYTYFSSIGRSADTRVPWSDQHWTKTDISPNSEASQVCKTILKLWKIHQRKVCLCPCSFPPEGVKLQASQGRVNCCCWSSEETWRQKMRGFRGLPPQRRGWISSQMSWWSQWGWAGKPQQQ